MATIDAARCIASRFAQAQLISERDNENTSKQEVAAFRRKITMIRAMSASLLCVVLTKPSKQMRIIRRLSLLLKKFKPFQSYPNFAGNN